MVPRISKRGHSFVGAAQYYLHDKKASTDERVAWTYTHNLPTDNAEKAFGWMAYTAMNANRLKQNAEVAKTGRKSNAGAVYSYSLAWHPEQNPERDTMQDAALEVLEYLGLQEHEAVFIAHSDTEHPHVHVVCNLVHPEHGKTAYPSYDYLTASRWAENLEKQEGKIRCEQRVINNEKRRQSDFQQSQSPIVKHREKRLENAQIIQNAYQNSSTGLQFQNSLKEAGFTLAKGDRRGFVIVDEHGKISSLSRQLKGQRAKDIKQRLNDVLDIPLAKQISEQILQKEGLETNNKKTETNEPKNPINPNSTPSDNFLKRLDAIRSWEQKTDQEGQRLERVQKEYYKREELIHKIQSLEALVLKKHTKEDKQQLDALKKGLDNINMRIAEQNDAFKKKILKTKPNSTKENDNQAKKQDITNYIKKQQEQKKNNDRKRGGRSPK